MKNAALNVLVGGLLLYAMVLTALGRVIKRLVGLPVPKDWLGHEDDE